MCVDGATSTALQRRYPERRHLDADYVTFSNHAVFVNDPRVIDVEFRAEW